MKNRIFWIFENGEMEAASIDEPQEEPQAPTEPTPFSAVPWAIFGRMAVEERASMEKTYREAFEKAQADRLNRAVEVARFERLLDGLELEDLEY